MNWRKNFLFWEGASALVLSAAFIWWAHGCGCRFVDSLLTGNRGAVYGALATIFGSLLGFTITAVSILVSFAPTDAFHLLSKSDHYPTLWKTYKAGIRWLAASTVATIVALVIDRDTHPVRLAQYAVVVSLTFALVRLARCLWILEKVIDIVTLAKQEPDKKE
jgi:hypothetical protein